MYGTICKHWQEEMNQYALILLCSGPEHFMRVFSLFGFVFFRFAEPGTEYIHFSFAPNRLIACLIRRMTDSVFVF